MSDGANLPQSLLDALRPKPAMSTGEWAAIVRLIKVAKSDTGQARSVANFLLAWWNASNCGGFDLTDLWGLDDDIKQDVVTVIGLIARRQMYPDALQYEDGSGVSFKADFQVIIARHRPALLDK